MDNTIYIALSRQTGLFRKMDVIANNIANASTSGFKGETLLFNEYLHDAGDAEVSFTQDIATVRDTRPGELQHTGRQLDAAIDGKGYYVIDTPLGERYTRVGSFQIGANRELVTSQGNLVQGQGGPILLDEKDAQITISEDGTVSARFENTEEVRGVIRVVKFDQEQELVSLPNGLYRSDDEAPQEASPGIGEDYTVAQGMVEQSNVNSVQQLTEMIKVNRSVGSTANLINDMHELQLRAMSTIARQN